MVRKIRIELPTECLWKNLSEEIKWTPKQVRETGSEFEEKFSRPGHVKEFYAWSHKTLLKFI
jgi:hypothetical protein